MKKKRSILALTVAVGLLLTLMVGTFPAAAATTGEKTYRVGLPPEGEPAEVTAQKIEGFSAWYSMTELGKGSAYPVDKLKPCVEVKGTNGSTWQADPEDRIRMGTYSKNVIINFLANELNIGGAAEIRAVVAAIKWEAPEDGTYVVNASGSTYCDIGQFTYGFYQGSTNLTSGTAVMNPAFYTLAENKKVELAKGDALWFVLDPGEGNNADGKPYGMTFARLVIEIKQKAPEQSSTELPIAGFPNDTGKGAIADTIRRGEQPAIVQPEQNGSQGNNSQTMNSAAVPMGLWVASWASAGAMLAAFVCAAVFLGLTIKRKTKVVVKDTAAGVSTQDAPPDTADRIEKEE